MKLTFAIVFTFVISSALVNASAIVSRALPGGCTAGQVLTHDTFNHEGSSVDYVTGTCNGGSPAKRYELEKRQNICTNGTCTVTCENLSSSPISASDCAMVVSYIQSYAPGSFTLPAGQYAYWSVGTCTVSAVNLDTVDYTMCYSAVAYDTAYTVKSCLGTTAGGVCVGSQAAGQMFGLGFA